MPPRPLPQNYWMKKIICGLNGYTNERNNANFALGESVYGYLVAVCNLTKLQSAQATLSAQQDEMLRVLKLQDHADALYSILCEMRQTRELIDSFDADIATLETRAEEARARMIATQQRLDDIQAQLMEAERVFQWATHRSQLRGGRRYSHKAQKAEEAERRINVTAADQS